MSSVLPANDEPYITRNGVKILNPGHFAADKQFAAESQNRSEALLHDIYTLPVESQAASTDKATRENESLAPYLFYSAKKSGHVNVAKAIQDSGKLALSGSLNFEDSVTSYRKQRNAELFSTSSQAKPQELQKWLQDFDETRDANQLMFDAAVAGDAEVIELLLGRGVEAYPADQPSLTTLHAACFNGNLECAQVLIANGIDVNIQDEFGGTPLMRAAVGARPHVVRWLLDNGAKGDVRETRDGSFNALEYTAGRSAELARLLLPSSGFSPTALMAAASFGNEESFDLIYEAADFPTIGESEDVPLLWQNKLSDKHREAIIGSIDQGGSGATIKIMDLLISYIPVGELQHHEAVVAAISTSLQRAVSSDNVQIAQRLLSIMANSIWPMESADTDNEINQLFSFAVESNATEVARLLLNDFHADVNQLSTPHYTTPLYFAASRGHLDMLLLLIDEHGADIHIASGKFANGPTPLAIAIQNQHENIVRALLAYGGPVEIADPQIQEDVTKRVFVSVARSLRYPVKLSAIMDPDWDIDGCTDRFLCLEFPDGWTGGYVHRREDVDMNDFRQLRRAEQEGFVVV